jgi:hypothetical protein
VTQRVRLGEITCPSGHLVVIDGGYLGIWSGDRSPAQVDVSLLGIDDPRAAADIRDAVDFEVVGPDAALAARLIAARQPDESYHSLYDIPASAATAFAAAFETLCADSGLDATLRAIDRVPHRDRARRAAADGAGRFQIFGVPALAATVPPDRPLWVVAEAEDDDARAEGRWSTVAVVLGEQSVASSVRVGVAGVDFARLAFADAGAMGAWEHEHPIDGLVDVVFWGRSQEEAAQAHDAPLLGTAGDTGTYGWVDMPVRAAVDRAQTVLTWVEAEPDRKLMIDFRPHSHHWRVMREVRASRTSSGIVEVGGARILFAMTGCGDGLFPVYADRDATGAVVAIRVALAEQ